MRVLSLLSLIPLALAQSSTLIPISTTPSPTSGGDAPPVASQPGASPQYKLYGWHNCNSGQQQAILDALAEKNVITGTNGVFFIDWNHQGVVDYFADPSQVKFNNYRDRIQTNLRNVYQFGNGWWLTGNDIEIFCGDGSFGKAQYKNMCRDLPGHIQFVNNYSSHDAAMFCNGWFRLGTLQAAMQNGARSADPYDVTNYENRALSWISALMMKKSVGVWPGDGGFIRRRSYYYPGLGRKWMTTPSAIKFLGRNRNTNGVDQRELAANADTWAWFAMTMYIQDKGLNEYPVRPYVPAGLRFEWEDRTNFLSPLLGDLNQISELNSTASAARRDLTDRQAGCTGGLISQAQILLQAGITIGSGPEI